MTGSPDPILGCAKQRGVYDWKPIGSNVNQTAGISTKCLAIQTYGIVIGLSSFKIVINTIEKMFDVKLPTSIAVAVYIEYYRVYPILVYISKYLVI